MILTGYRLADLLVRILGNTVRAGRLDRPPANVVLDFVGAVRHRMATRPGVVYIGVLRVGNLRSLPDTANVRGAVDHFRRASSHQQHAYDLFFPSQK